MYFLINRGISHSTPLPMGEGLGGCLFSPYLQPHRVLYIRLTDQLQVAFAERTDPYILSSTHRGDDG